MLLSQQASDSLEVTPLDSLCQVTLEMFMPHIKLNTVLEMHLLSPCVDLSLLLVEHIWLTDGRQVETTWVKQTSVFSQLFLEFQQLVFVLWFKAISISHLECLD